MGVGISSLEGRTGVPDVSINKGKVRDLQIHTTSFNVMGEMAELDFCEPAWKPPFILLWFRCVPSSIVHEFKTNFWAHPFLIW